MRSGFPVEHMRNLPPWPAPMAKHRTVQPNTAAGMGLRQSVAVAADDSAWDPRRLHTLDVRMEHDKYWVAAEAAEVSGRVA
jgi:hypothetical protein